MTLKARYISIGVVIALVPVLAFSLFYVAKANPSLFLRGQTSSATTTLSYLTPGAATTTTTAFDLGAGAAQGADSAILALQLTGSSTPNNAATATTTYNVTIEYSQNAVDWYSDNTGATSSTAISLSTPIQRTITLGTQTLRGVLVASSTPTKVVFPVNTPARYVRAVISIPLGSTNGAVWAEFIAKRQSN